MSNTPGKAKTVIVIGGGVSGCLTAYHLVRQHAKASVMVVDPRPELGLGLAYSTPSLRHLLNVPAAKISVLPDQPLHFLHWLQRHFDADATASTFAPRAVFGRYIQSLLAETSGITQVRNTVVDGESCGKEVRLTLASGEILVADYVVLATGNFDPAALPGIDHNASLSGAYCHNAWLPATYEHLAEDAPVALIGTGLTAVDVLLRLRELGHRGVITAVSRHGVLPRRHAPCAEAACAAVADGTPATCVAYLRAFRASLRSGVEWRTAIDSLRASTNELWLALPAVEQKRFKRHLQRRWDVVRHRMAPAVADGIDAELAAGTLLLRDGHVTGVAAEMAGASVGLSTREGMQKLYAARVINCTGPSMNYRKVESPLLACLFARGIAMPGPLGGGLLTAQSGAMISARSTVSESIFQLGPGRLGTLLESIAIPELRQQAVDLAALLTRRLQASESSSSMHPLTFATTASPLSVAVGVPL